MTNKIPPRMIGITGYAGAGKDALAGFLRHEMTQLGFAYQYSPKTAFSWPIKEMLVYLSGEKEPFFEDKTQQLKLFPVTGRYAAQSLGTEWGRQLIDEDIWVKVHAARWTEAVIVADVRFENEAEYVRENGILIHIERPAAIGESMTHSSEDGVAVRWDVDFLVRNEFNLEYLRAQAIRIATKLTSSSEEEQS